MKKLSSVILLCLQILVGLSAQPEALAQQSVVGAVENLGGGLAGTEGIPNLDVTGVFAPGNEVVFSISQAKPNTNFVLVAGATIVNLPIFGGILIPNPELLVPGATDAQGHAQVALTWQIPLGVTYFQFGVVDPSAVEGWALSNAISVRSGPEDVKQGGLTVGEIEWNKGLVKGFTLRIGALPLQSVSSWHYDPNDGLYHDTAGNTALHHSLQGVGEVVDISAGSQHAGRYEL